MKHAHVIKNSGIYVFSNMLVKACNFLMVPLYTAFLSTSEYGITNLAVSFNIVAIYVISLCLFNAVIRFLADCRDDAHQKKILLGTTISFVFLSGGVFSIILILCRDLLTKYIFIGVPFVPTLLLIISSLTFLTVYILYQDILKGMHSAKKSAVTSIAYFFTQLSLKLVFVAGFKQGANGVFLSDLITNCVFCGWILFDLHRSGQIKIGIEFPLLKKLLKYSVPLLPHNLSPHITAFVSRIFIGNIWSMASVGIYGLASQFGTIADVAQTSVNSAYQPWFYDQMLQRKDGYRRDIRKLCRVLLWAYGLLFIALSIFSKEIILVMANSAYAEAWKAIPLIVLTFVIKTPYYFYIDILLYYKNATKRIFIATLASAAVNIALTYVLVERYGLYGSIYADIIAMFIRIAIMYIISRKFNDAGIRFTDFISNFFIILPFAGLGLFLSYTGDEYSISMRNVLIKIMIVAAYCIIAFLVNRKSLDLAFIRRKSNV